MLLKLIYNTTSGDDDDDDFSELGEDLASATQ